MPRHATFRSTRATVRIFSFFFFEGTKSLSAILNLQPGIEIHTQLFRRIKLRPFSTLIIFFALSLHEKSAFELASTLFRYVIAENEAFQIQSLRSKAIQ